MKRALSAVLLLVVVTGACGGTAEVAGSAEDGAKGGAASVTLVESSYSGLSLIAADSHGAMPTCPPRADGYIMDPAPASVLLNIVFEWVDVPLDELQRAMDNSGPDDRDTGKMRLGSLLPNGIADLKGDSTTIALRRGGDGFEEWLFFPGMEQLLDNRGGTRALVGLEPAGHPGTGFMDLVAIENPDGSFTLLGECGYGRVAAAIGEYARNTSTLGAYAVLREIATDDEKLLDFDQWPIREPVAWASRPPKERQLDVEATPAEVLDSLERILIVIESVPQQWRDFDAGLCSWMGQGWNLCTVFDAYPVGEPLDVDAYFDIDEVLEIWLVDGDANLTAPLAKLGTFDAGDLDDEGALRLRVVGEWPTVESLIAGAKEGRTVFEAVP